MLVIDLTLCLDSEFEKILCRFLNNPQALDEAFVRTWFKLMHYDTGPESRCIGPKVPREDLIWQDPPPCTFLNPSKEDILELKATIAASGLFVDELVSVAWAFASAFRGGDKHGGVNGTRLALDPQCGWDVNATAARVLPMLEDIYKSAHTTSLTDIIVLAGAVGIE